MIGPVLMLWDDEDEDGALGAEREGICSPFARRQKQSPPLSDRENRKGIEPEYLDAAGPLNNT